jgi:hypothetical protein
VNESERHWKSFKRTQMKAYEDHIQMMEREVMSEIAKKEAQLQLKLNEIRVPLPNPSLSPLSFADFSSPSDALLILPSLLQKASFLETEAGQIKQLVEDFTQKGSEAISLSLLQSTQIRVCSA